MWKNSRFGFTLIELLIAIGVLAVVSSGILYYIGQGPAQGARDARRRADLEKVVSGLEFYRNGNATYPRCPGNAANCFATTITNGVGMPAITTYLPTLPEDPQTTNRRYRYAPFDSGNGSCNGAAGDRCVRYILCAALEKGSGSVAGCGTCGSQTCNYSTASP